MPTPFPPQTLGEAWASIEAAAKNARAAAMRAAGHREPSEDDAAAGEAAALALGARYGFLTEAGYTTALGRHALDRPQTAFTDDDGERAAIREALPAAEQIERIEGWLEVGGRTVGETCGLARDRDAQELAIADVAATAGMTVERLAGLLRAALDEARARRLTRVARTERELRAYRRVA